MNKINIGIIGTSEIAFRRFLPALLKNDKFNYIGIASRDLENTKKFIDEYGGIGYSSYEQIIDDKNIDALYIPLPPALHYEWAKKALENGKHVFLEKPSTTKLDDTKDLLKIANEKKLALKENYMFLEHKQLHKIKDIINNKVIGDLRLIRCSFGFPMRSGKDFRYNKKLGGGALLDCGGYPIRLMIELLGENIKIDTSKLYYIDEFNVELYGDVTLSNNNVTAQISFGMDNEYKCELELWGNKGYLKAPRIFTAPPEYNVTFDIIKQGKVEMIDIGSDDQFYNSINHFYNCINNEKVRNDEYLYIERQSNFIEIVKGE
jgi:NAD binding oxidoreductase